MLTVLTCIIQLYDCYMTVCLATVYEIKPPVSHTSIQRVLYFADFQLCRWQAVFAAVFLKQYSAALCW